MNILSKYLDCQLFGLLFPNFGRIFFQSSGHPGCLYNKCCLDLTLALASALASKVNYNHKWCHNLEHHLLTTPVIIYDWNMFRIQATPYLATMSVMKTKICITLRPGQSGWTGTLWIGDLENPEPDRDSSPDPGKLYPPSFCNFLIS